MNLLERLEGQYLTGFCGGSDVTSELAGDADHLLHQLSVGAGQDSLAQVNIVLETYPDVASVDDGGCSQRELVAADTRYGGSPLIPPLTPITKSKCMGAWI